MQGAAHRECEGINVLHLFHKVGSTQGPPATFSDECPPVGHIETRMLLVSVPEVIQETYVNQDYVCDLRNEDTRVYMTYVYQDYMCDIHMSHIRIRMSQIYIYIYIYAFVYVCHIYMAYVYEDIYI